MPPINTIAEQLWKDNRQGVGGTRRKVEEPETKDYQPEKYTDSCDNRCLGKYFKVGMRTRR